jgi:fermentation-respiration switch protein FrsA (DUF1100 family)
MTKAISTAMLMGALILSSGCASKCFYYPTHQIYQTPAQHRLNYEDVTFESNDGTRLNGWLIPATGKAIGTVIHFHGNAQNMSAHLSFVDWIPAEGFNLFVFDYRGYGQSEGSPNRRGVYQDGLAAIDYVKSRTDVDPNKLLILGQSLGGANAISVMGRNRIDGVRAVAIESTFYSYRQIVRDKLAHIPVLSILRWPLSFMIVGNGYSPGKVVGNIAPVPLLLIHGTADRVIPFHHGKELYEKAGEPKQFWEIEHGKHTEAFTTYGRQYREALVKFYKAALASQ